MPKSRCSTWASTGSPCSPFRRRLRTIEGSVTQLRPWGSSPNSAISNSVVPSIPSGAPSPCSIWRKTAGQWRRFQLGERLLGATAERERPHPLEWPGRVLEAIRRGTLAWSAFKEGASDAGVAALFAVAKRRGVAVRVVVHGIWVAWAALPESLAAGSPLSPSSPHASVFFAHAPAEAIRVLFAGEWSPFDAVPYEALDEAAWPRHRRRERRCASRSRLRGARSRKRSSETFYAERT